MKGKYKNQIIIYVIAFMLVTAGYLSYTEKNVIEVSSNNENRTDENIGDATLVSSINTVNEANGQEVKTQKEETQQENQSEDVSNQENIKSEEKAEEDNAVQETNTQQQTEDDYFSYSKLEREKMYSQMLETYQKMLDNTNIPEEQKSIASQEIKNINDTRNAIMICENLITTKGFSNVVIFVNADSINIVVRADKLTAEQTAQIQNIVNREMNAEIENIHIMTH